MSEQDNNRKEKKTNFQRLYRNAKKAEIAYANLAEGIETTALKMIKDDKDLEAFKKAVQYYREVTQRSLINRPE